MSRIGNLPITLPKGVVFVIKDLPASEKEIEISGPKGKLLFVLKPAIAVTQKDSELLVSKVDSAADALSGTVRAVLNNMVHGVLTGYEKKLQLQGVGYRAKISGKKLSLTIGFSHPVEYIAPDSIEIKVPTETEIIVSGPDKVLVGQVAADIRAFREPECYKGKGIRYFDEVVRLKAGKSK